MALKPFWLVAALALAACGNDTNDDSYSNLATRMMESRKPPQEVPLPSSAVLAQQQGSYMVGRIEATGGNALMIGGGQNGNVTTWMTADGATIATRDGVLIATRGLRGSDLMSAAVPSRAQIARGAGTHSRAMYYIGDLDRMERSDFLCELGNAGTERVEIVDRSYNVMHIVEACTGKLASFENHYWFDDSGVIRRSRQWIGQAVGSIELDLLKG